MGIAGDQFVSCGEGRRGTKDMARVLKDAELKAISPPAERRQSGILSGRQSPNSHNLPFQSSAR
jgi:hypothetical protein